ncbi:MAG: radical SAM protein, partial [Deltaproteobacteria bacterium]|nr:radical SAM protein [Deltaproteobacteria bacterium]
MGDIYSFAKIFHFTAKLESIANEMLTPPIHIRLKPTNRCNHGCSYCCYRNPDLHLSELMRHDDHIPAGKMEEIISDIAGMGVRAVTFSGGGEPLIYPYFSDAAEGLMTRGVKVSVLTNGSLLNGDIAGLLGGGAAWVRVSMDGASPEDYSKARGVSVREFGKVCSNIGNFARIKRKECQLGV